MELREIRKAKGLTQKEAAKIAGVSFESYKNHELGRSKNDRPLGKMIIDVLMSYEPFDFDRGVLPFSLIEEKIAQTFSGKPIEFAYLFGSYAKGEATDSSDVDLLIHGSITGLEYFSLGGELERVLHKKVDVLRFDDIAANPELVAEIMRTGVRIYDKEKR